MVEVASIRVEAGAGGQLQQVADVVQQGGGDERVGRAVGGGEGGGLQRVVELGDLLVVPIEPVLLEQRDDVGDRPRCVLVGLGRAHRTGRPWKSPMSDTCTWSSPSGWAANSASLAR